MEVPDEVGTHFNQAVVVCFGGDGFKVDPGVAGGNAVEQFLPVQQLHGLGGLAVNTLTPAAVGGLLEAFQGNGGDEVLHPEHFVGKLLINEGAVGKGQENAVTVLFTQTNQVVLAHHGLTAGVDVHIDAHVFALTDNVVDFLEGQV